MTMNFALQAADDQVRRLSDHYADAAPGDIPARHSAALAAALDDYYYEADVVAATPARTWSALRAKAKAVLITAGDSCGSGVAVSLALDILTSNFG